MINNKIKYFPIGNNIIINNEINAPHWEYYYIINDNINTFPLEIILCDI